MPHLKHKGEVHFFGPAANAQQTANLLNQLSGGNKNTVTLEVHKWDFVGTTIGGNPPTYDKVPDGSTPIAEWYNMFSKDYSIHGCYGKGQQECEKAYGPSKSITIKAKQ